MTRRCWCPLQIHFSFLAAASQDDAQKLRCSVFRNYELTILWTRFEKHPHISQKEAEHVAKILNTNPGKIMGWFKRQRHCGGLRGIENTVEGRDYLTI